MDAAADDATKEGDVECGSSMDGATTYRKIRIRILKLMKASDLRVSAQGEGRLALLSNYISKFTFSRAKTLEDEQLKNLHEVLKQMKDNINAKNQQSKKQLMISISLNKDQLLQKKKKYTS